MDGRTRLGGALGALLTCGALLGAGLAVAVPAAAEPTPGIEVQVTRTGAGSVEGVDVVALRQSASRWVVAGSGTTDAGGTATMSVPTGSYRVCAIESDERLCGPGATGPGRAPAVVVDGAQVTARVGLAAHSTVTGLVTRDGVPVPGAQVVLLGEGFPFRQPSLGGSTGPDGRYQFAGAVPGPFRVCAVRPAPDGSPAGSLACSAGSSLMEGTPRTVAPGGTLVENLALLDPPTVSGRVTLPDGSPADGSLMTFVDVDGVPVPTVPASVDASGHFSTQVVSSRTHLCWQGPAAGNDVPTSACYGGPNLGTPLPTGGTIDFPIPRAGRVHGRVVDLAGAPVSGASVSLVLAGLAPLTSPADVPTDPSTGEFTATGLTPGTFAACASAGVETPVVGCRGWYDDQVFTVRAGQTTDVGDLVAQPLNELSLQVLDEHGVPVPVTVGLFTRGASGSWQVHDQVTLSGGAPEQLTLPRGRFRICTLDLATPQLPFAPPSVDWCHGAVADVEDATDVVLDGPARSLTLAVPRGFGEYRALRAPQVSGAVKLGGTLTATPGAWSPRGASFGYRWRADGVALAGETGSRLALTPALVGKRISVVVTATGGRAEDGSAASLPTAPVAVGALRVVTQPKLSGKPKVGKVVRVSAGRYTPSRVTVRYQWFAGKKAVAKARKAELKLTRKLKGKKLSVRLTVTAPGYRTLVRKVPAGKVR